MCYELKRLDPLFSDENEYSEFKARHEKASTKRGELSSYVGNTYLGIDAGSTTTKLALIGENGELLYSYYSGNGGSPIKTAINAMAELEKFKKEHTGALNFRDNARMHIYAGTVARYETQQTVDTVEIEFHVLRLGDIAFATNPYELFLNYGNQIRARSLAKQTFMIQLCCGSYGYLPTEKAEKGSHYSAYVSSGTSGHEGGDLLVRKTLTEINEMWRK